MGQQMDFFSFSFSSFSFFFSSFTPPTWAKMGVKKKSVARGRGGGSGRGGIGGPPIKKLGPIFVYNFFLTLCKG